MKIPEDFTEYPETLMTNCDHSIDEDVKKHIKGKQLYSAYSGWNFYGTVWWAENKWLCLIMTYGTTKEIVTKDSLEEIMTDVCETYGSE